MQTQDRRTSPRSEKQSFDEMNVFATAPTFRASSLLVACSLMLSLTTWGIYAAACVGKAGDEAFGALILLVFASPLPALAGVIVTINTVDRQTRRTWLIQFVASVTSAVLAMLALFVFYSI